MKVFIKKYLHTGPPLVKREEEGGVGGSQRKGHNQRPPPPPPSPCLKAKGSQRDVTEGYTNVNAVI